MITTLSPLLATVAILGAFITFIFALVRRLIE